MARWRGRRGLVGWGRSGRMRLELRVHKICFWSEWPFIITLLRYYYYYKLNTCLHLRAHVTPTSPTMPHTHIMPPFPSRPNQHALPPLVPASPYPPTTPMPASPCPHTHQPCPPSPHACISISSPPSPHASISMPTLPSCMLPASLHQHDHPPFMRASACPPPFPRLTLSRETWRAGEVGTEPAEASSCCANLPPPPRSPDSALLELNHAANSFTPRPPAAATVSRLGRACPCGLLGMWNPLPEAETAAASTSSGTRQVPGALLGLLYISAKLLGPIFSFCALPLLPLFHFIQSGPAC